MGSQELAFTPATELASLIRLRAVSPVEVVDTFLQRIDALDGKLHAYITVAADEARAAAVESEKALGRGRKVAPLHGVPVSIKDTEYTRGIRSTAGSLIYKDFVPSQDSILVERLRKAGVIILGKTNTPEFAMSAETDNWIAGYCYNPWDLTRTTGGSSGGSGAAIAAGLACLATGSDAGGSITIPAGFCGTFGMKPTHGRIPNWPISSHWASFLDSGPITRTVRDAALMLSVASGYDARAPLSLNLRRQNYLRALEAAIPKLRIAWSSDLGYAQIDPEARKAAEAGARAFEELGCSVEEARPDIRYPFDIWHAISRVEEYAGFGHLLKDHAHELRPNVKARLEEGRDSPGVRYHKAYQEMLVFRRVMREFFKHYDLLLTPTNSVAAFPANNPPTVIDGHKVQPNWEGYTPFSLCANLAELPMASLPCGLSSEGLPLGLLAFAPWGRDAMLLRACAAYEVARPWAERVPPLVRL